MLCFKNLASFLFNFHVGKLAYFYILYIFDGPIVIFC